MTLLRWVVAERDDRDALRDFECTSPQSRRVRRAGRWEDQHPAKYERAAQTLIRTKIKPVGDPYRTVLLGWHGRHLGAVCSYRSIGGSSQYVIEVVAVSTKLQQRGRGWGIEALTTALNFITAEAHAHGYSLVTVMAGIHEKNQRSQRLFEGQGFQPTAVLPDRYQGWSAEFPVAGAPTKD